MKSGWILLLSLLAFSLASHQSAATPSYHPLTWSLCNALRGEVEDALGTSVSISEAAFSDYLTGQAGTGCLVATEGTGKDFPAFLTVLEKLKELLESRGWREDVRYLADGPTGTATAFRRGEQLVLVSVGWQSATGACPTDKSILECTLTPAQQHYTITLNAASSASPELEQLPAALSARQILAQILGVTLEKVTLIDATPLTFTNICLDVAGSGPCARTPTPGFEVTFEVAGQHYIFHTDETGGDVRLAAAPTPDLSGTVLTWYEQNFESCDTALINPEAIVVGPCNGALITGRWAGPERAADLAYFMTTYAPFGADTAAGHIEFQGRGSRTASPAEQRMMAEWARLVRLEALSGRSGAAWGLAFAWHREDGIAGFCDDLTVYVTGEAFASSCRGDSAIHLGSGRLRSEELGQLYRWVDTYRGWELDERDLAVADALILHMVFSGAGTAEPTPEDKQAIQAFAVSLFQKLSQKPEPADSQDTTVKEFVRRLPGSWGDLLE